MGGALVPGLLSRASSTCSMHRTRTRRSQCIWHRHNGDSRFGFSGYLGPGVRRGRLAGSVLRFRASPRYAHVVLVPRIAACEPVSSVVRTGLRHPKTETTGEKIWRTAARRWVIGSKMTYGRLEKIARPTGALNDQRFHRSSAGVEEKRARARTDRGLA